MTMTTIIRTAALALAATLALTACNKNDSNISFADDNVPVSFDFSAMGLATRALPSDFSADLAFNYYTYSLSDAPTGISSLTSGSSSTQYMMALNGNVSMCGDDLYISPGEGVYGYFTSGAYDGSAFGSVWLDVDISDGDIMDVTPLDDYIESGEMIDYGSQRYFSLPTKATFSSPKITAELIPLFNAYSIDDINVTCVNENLEVVITEPTIEYIFVPSYRVHVGSDKKAVQQMQDYGKKWVDLGSTNAASALKDSGLSIARTPQIEADGTTAFMPGTLKECTLSMPYVIQDKKTKAVGASGTMNVRLDLTKYNAPFTSYHFTLTSVVDGYGGPVSSDISARQLAVANESVTFDWK